MAYYEKQDVIDAASGQWEEVISHITGLPLSILDGKHHPCPVCGGDDRFNAARDGSGGVFCNTCPDGKTKTGINSVMHWGNLDYVSALEAIANRVGVKPKKQSRQIDPAEHLEFLPWNNTLIGLWCLKKKPIKPDAIKSIGGRLARYHAQYTVIAIPVWGSSLGKASPVGWVLYRADGGELPRHSKNSDKPEWVKVKLTAGSKKGIITKVSEDGTIKIGNK